jgi:hypothetical protein
MIQASLFRDPLVNQPSKSRENIALRIANRFGLSSPRSRIHSFFDKLGSHSLVQQFLSPIQAKITGFLICGFFEELIDFEALLINRPDPKERPLLAWIRVDEISWSNGRHSIKKCRGF